MNTTVASLLILFLFIQKIAATDSTEGNYIYNTYWTSGNASDDIVRQSYTMTKVVNLYLTPPVSIAGIICNVLSMAVLSRDESMPPTTSTFLQTLAAADLLNIVFSIPLTSFSLISAYSFTLLAQPLLTAVCRPLQSTAFTASVWVQVLVTAERYAAVCYPMHVSRVVSLSRTRKTIIVVWLLSAGFNVCRGFEDHFFVRSSFVDYNDTLWAMPFGLLHDEAYHITYNMILHPAVTVVLPFVLLVFFTIRILRGLKKSFKEQVALISADEQKQKKLALKQRRTTATLVSIVIIFLGSQILMFVHFICSLNRPFYAGYDSWEYSRKIIDDSIISIAYLFTSLQSMLNFFIYCVSGQRYRDAVRGAFACNK